MNMTVNPRLLMLPVVCALLVGGCRERKRGETSAVTEAMPIASGTASAAVDTIESAEATAHPDPHHPPIDCPLRKQGIDLTQLRPFEDVQKYIAFLERADRAAWQKPDAVVASLGLEGTETVVDLGAGSGYLSFRFAAALPKGKVVAADTEAEMIRHIHHRAMAEGIDNVEATLVAPADPALPPGADLIFVCDVLHHVHDRAGWLGKLTARMKPSARLVLIEFKEGQLPEGPPDAVKIPRAELVRLATGAGLTLESEQKELLPHQVFLVFRMP
jgi:SAM-dependent methyltransferase